MTELKCEIRCPHCGRLNDRHAATRKDAGLPESGSVGICWDCGRPAVFFMSPYGLGLRLPTPAEEKELDDSSEMQAAYALMARAKARHAR